MGISSFSPKSHGTVKTEGAACEQGITAEKWSGFQRNPIIHEIGEWFRYQGELLSETDDKK